MLGQRSVPPSAVSPRRLLFALLLVAGATLIGCGKKAVTVDRAALPADLALVPSDATAFVRIRVADILQTDLVKGLRQTFGAELAKAEQEMTKQLGIGLDQIESVTIIVLALSGPEEAETPPVLAAIATTAPIDRNKLFGTPAPPERTHAGRTYSIWSKMKGQKQAVHFAGDRLTVVGPEDAMTRFLDSAGKTGAGRLDPALKAATEKHHVVAGAQVPDWVAKEMRDAPLPPALAFVKPLTETQSATITFDLGKELVYEVRLAYADKSKAKDAAAALRQGMDMARQQFGQRAGREDPALAAVMKQLDAFFDKVAIESDGPEVLVKTQFDSAVYLALLVPAVQKVREASDRMNSGNNLKQIAIAMHDYESEYRQLPPQAIMSKDGKPLLSWRVAILPYVEQNTLYKQFKLDEPWDSTHNRTLLNQMPKLYQHPMSKAEPGMTHYQVFAGKKTAFEPGQKMTFASILDGTSNTVMVVEAADPVPWTKPADLVYEKDKPLPKLGGMFANGFNAAFCDGAVRFIDQKVDPKLLRLVIERDDGEAVDLEKLSP